MLVIEVTVLAGLAYVPFLLSLRGRVSADTKQYLYLDPGRLLERAPYLWDPHVAAGTVPHQNIGYLFPMGPWFWAFDALGVPDWVAQRLWLGTISFAAALGARWLLRSLGAGPIGAFAGAVIYLWTPYQLAFTARISVLLLAWAGLPWLVGLTMRAVRGGGWRYPAMFALVILTTGSVNASTLVFALIGPAVWLVLELGAGRQAVRAVLAATGRIALLTLGVSVWWLAGLRLQGAYGLPVLRLTESLSWVAEKSRPDDVLRGLGNWFFYGEDKAGFALDQALEYLVGGRVSLASYAIPVLALVAAAFVRWRHRTFALLLVIVGTIVAVGSWPFEDQTTYGRLWRDFTEDSSVGLALRNSPRVVPLVILGLSALLAAGITAQPTVRRRVGTGVLVVLLAVAAIGPVWRTGFLSERLARPEEVPAYWREAAAAMERGGDQTRVLEIPGANFAGYRWGNAIEPITPGLIDRPYLAREVLPYGSAPSVNLLDAFDRRFQSGTFEPASLAPVARLFAVGTVALRADLDANRFDSAPPEEVWDELTTPRAPGLRAPQGFGPPIGPRGDAPPSVALFDVDDPVRIVHVRPVRAPVVLAGDGDGIVDAAAAGLIDGRGLLLPLAALDDDELRSAMANGAPLLLTDSNRRRPQHWFFSVRRNKGPTERAGATTPDPPGYDYRLEVFPGSGDDDRTVVEQVGGQVDATADGGAARPEDRAVYAFDGDLRTSWRVGGSNPRGERVVVEPARPVRTDHVVLVQPQEGPRDRVLTAARLRFDDGSSLSVDLGPESLRPTGQVVRFPERTVRRLEVELVDTTTPPFDPRAANAVGFAEVRLGDVRVNETVRVPVALAARTAGEVRGHGLDVVLTRLRVDPADRTRQDEELRLDRRIVLPDDRTFRLGGMARVNGDAPDEVLDTVLGTTTPGTTFSATSHRHGDASSRASRAFDDDDVTAWTAAQGPQEGQALMIRTTAPTRFGAVTVTFVDSPGHSTPTRLHVEADGRRVGSAVVAGPTDRDPPGIRTVRIEVPGVTADELRVVIDAVDRRTAVPGDPAPTETLPVSLVDVSVDGLPEAAIDGRIDGSCRDDLLTIDGDPIGLRIGAPATAGRTVYPVESCEPLDLGRGSHRLVAATGLDAGIDLDRLVLTSGADGRPAAIGPRGAGSTGGAEVTSVDTRSPTSMNVGIRTDGRPFWLVLGQSANRGWAADSGAATMGPRQLVDGYANGWLVDPEGPGTTQVRLRWTPQRLVWGGLVVSAVAVVACLAVVFTPVLRRRPGTGSIALADLPVLGSPPRGPWALAWGPVDALIALVAGGAMAAVSRPWIGIVTAVTTAIATVVPPSRLAIGLAAPAALVLGRLRDNPELAWLAIGLLVTGVASEAASRWKARRRPGS